MIATESNASKPETFFGFEVETSSSSLPAGDGFLFLSRDEPVKFLWVSNGRQGLGLFSL